MVTETPEIYKDYVRPFMQRNRDAGRLDWVFNVLDGRAEQKDVILRDPGMGAESGFLMAPDLNWDRKTVTSMHLLGLVERRDLWSLRDLKKGHVEWLKGMREKLLDAVVGVYGEKGVERDMLKLYVHCAPQTPWHSLHLSACTVLIFSRYRSTDLLPFPHSYRPRPARSRQHPSHRQSVRARKYHFPARKHGRWARGRHGGCELDLLRRRGQRTVDEDL